MDIKTIFFIASSCLASFLQPTIGRALGLDDLKITRFGSFFVTERVPNVVFYFGDVAEGDSFDFRKILRSNESADTLVLVSNGGSVYEALQISGIIHDNNIRTYIPPYSTCASACSFAYFAGRERIANGDLGVHQFSSNSSAGTEEIAQYTVSEIISFLNSFNVPPFVFEKMFETDPSQMYFFDEDEKRKIQIPSEAEPNWIKPIDAFLIELSEIASLPSNSPTSNEADSDTATPSTIVELTARIQAELNRIGCYVGNPDGVIGSRSMAGLSHFAKIVGIEPREELFYSDEFLKILQVKEVGFCPKPLPPPEIPIAKNWSSVAKCGSGTVNGSISLTPADDGQSKTNFYMHYTNLAGQVWVGLASKSGRSFFFELEIKKGSSAIKTLKGSGRFESNYTHLNGTDSLGCKFYASAI